MVAAILLLTSCDSKRYKYEPYKREMSGNKQEISKTTFEIDFKQTEGNLKTIHVNINGNNSYDAIFDTGCSRVLISSLEALEMIKQGTLRKSDFIGTERAQLADGSVTEQEVYNIREITVMDKNGKPHTLRDVAAMLEPNVAASILIGSAVIDNLAKKSYTVDLRRKVIRFE